jgi:hypothetical protein
MLLPKQVITFEGVQTSADDLHLGAGQSQRYGKNMLRRHRPNIFGLIGTHL